MTVTRSSVAGILALSAAALFTACTRSVNTEPASADVPMLENGIGLTPEQAAAVAANNVLFWTPEEQIAGYPHMEDKFPTHTIHRGDKVSPFLTSETPLDVAFLVEGETWTLDDYMVRNRTAGLLIVKDGAIISEKYGLGQTPESRWTSFSVAKSFSSTMVGAAIKDGFIKSIDDPVTNYLEGLKGSAYEGVSIRNLLNMTSGVDWNEDYSDPNSDVALFSQEPSINGSDPTVTYMSRLPRKAEPGSLWAYKTGETNLVGSLVRAATKKPLSQYLSEKVWAPYGMEQDAVWMLDLGAGEIAGCCVSATLRDYGRFAEFFRNGAKIDGVSIVPDDWIKDATTSTQPAFDALNGQAGYGYQWWTTPGPAYRASGIFGQGIWINPELGLVIVTQSAWPGATDEIAARNRQLMINAVETAVRTR